MSGVSSASTFRWDATSNERLEKALTAAGGIERWGLQGFTEEVIAELGYEGDDGPRRTQVQSKLKRMKDTAAETPEAKQERLELLAARKATAREGKEGGSTV